MTRKFLLLVVLLYSIRAMAGWIDGNGAPVADSAERKSSGEFGVYLAVTADPKAFVDAWGRPGKPNLRSAKTVKRGSSVSAVLLFSGCKANSDGRCQVDVKYRLISPDGSSQDVGTYPVTRRAAPKPRIIELGDAIAQFDFERTDAPGTYRIVAIVTDQYGKRTLEVSTDVVAVE
ncbi:hypothetical protein [Cupriavidus pinatubonensis]|uniref:hypothetical protein n=1 Tax=Cupriavidus pinatubonensis TaxID=248026 RepID=UPI003608557D